ncbi:MAG: DUF2946 domain-containing protein [Burkholderiaceae bacterium]
MPSISHALAIAKGSGVSLMEICSTTGAKFVKVADSQNPIKSSAPAEKALHLEHCPFCLTHAGSFGLPPTVAFALPVASGSQALPSLFYQAPSPLFIWAAAQSRAPPFTS